MSVNFAEPVDQTIEDNAPKTQASDLLAPDCRGQNFYDIDPSLPGLLRLYLDKALTDHLDPHLRELGGIAGGRLDELAEASDKHIPRLHSRDRFGRDEEWVEFHPAYREMEKIAFRDFGIHAASHRPGVLGWDAPFPHLAKYALQYLFVQAEFGLMCPVSVTDTSAYLVSRYASDHVKETFLPRMLSQDMGELLKCAQFMTEKAGGSDVANSELLARPDGDVWRLHGEKWFCSCADADVGLLLARPEGAPAGSRGLGLFLLPKTLPDGSRNSYRIVRLKDKLGTRSMASGEIKFDGAVAHLLGSADRGLKQMMDQVSFSRLSHGVRAAAMMRRCLNESLAVARDRRAFGKALIEHPLMRRQLMKIMVPTEQALSVAAYTADLVTRSEAGDSDAATRLRIATPLLKFRTARDNIAVATGAMEVRGGNGYIEDWVNARLVRDAHVGVLWEGTSNINALDIVNRAVGKVRAHEALAQDLNDRLDSAPGLPGQFRGELSSLIGQAVAFASAVAEDPSKEHLSRQVSGALYHVMSAGLMAIEGTALAEAEGDARRLLLARLVVAHRLSGNNTLSLETWPGEETAIDLLLTGERVPLDQATAALN